MNAVGSALWRSISAGSSANLLSRNAFTNLAPLRRTLALKQRSIRSFPWIPGNTFRQLHYARFSTSSRCPDKIPNPSAATPSSPTSEAIELPILSSRKLRNIFSQEVDPTEGNEILQEIQEARAQGTLDKGIPDVPNSMVAKGLAWLRTEIPLDEDAAILARLDREEVEEVQANIAQAVEFGIYSSEEGAELTKQSIQNPSSVPLVYIPQHNAAENARYGKSVFEEMQKKRKRRRELLKKKKERAEERAKDKAVKLGLPVTMEERRVARQKELRLSRVERLEDTLSVYGKKGEGWPIMTPWQRLWPSTLLTLGIIGLSALFATYYTPPPRSARIWPELSAAQATLAALIGFQFLVFCGWHLTIAQRFLFKHFISVPGYPRVTGLLGNTFSHQKFFHLLANATLLGIFGTQRKSAPLYLHCFCRTRD